MRNGIRRSATAGMVMVLLAAGCSDDDDAAGGPEERSEESVQGLRPAEELEAGLLTVDDLPTGWSQSADAEDDDGNLCDLELAPLLDLDLEELPNAERSFEVDADVGPFFGESIGFVPEGRGGEALDGAAEALDGCEDEIDGARVAVTRLSFPTVGDESIAYRMSVEDEAFAVDFSVVYTRVDDLLLVLYAADPLGDSTAVLQELAEPAIEKASAALL